MRQKSKELLDSVGGQERYQEMLGWAADNLSKDEIAMFDGVIESGSKDIASLLSKH